MPLNNILQTSKNVLKDSFIYSVIERVMESLRWQHTVVWLNALIAAFLLFYIPITPFTSVILFACAIGFMVPFLHLLYLIFTNFDDLISHVFNFDEVSSFWFILSTFLAGLVLIFCCFHFFSTRSYVSILFVLSIVVLFVILTTCLLLSLIGIAVCAVISKNHTSARKVLKICSGEALASVLLLLLFALFAMPMLLSPLIFFGSLPPASMVVIDLLCLFSIILTLICSLYFKFSSDMNPRQILSALNDSSLFMRVKPCFPCSQPLEKLEMKQNDELHTLKENEENNLILPNNP